MFMACILYICRYTQEDFEWAVKIDVSFLHQNQLPYLHASLPHLEYGIFINRTLILFLQGASRTE